MSDHLDCERFERIALDRAERRDIAEADQAFASAHLQACRECQQLTAAAALLADPDAAGVARDDELARRRWVAGLLEREAAMDEELGLAPRRRWPVAAVAASALAAVAVLVLAWTLAGARHGDGPGSPDGVAQPIPGSFARVLGVSGTARADSTTLRSGDALRQGQVLRVQSGALTARLSDEVTLVLDADSELRVIDTSASKLAVLLERGTLANTVSPLGPGRSYRVQTRFGEIAVAGTRFTVTADQHHAEVRVTQGIVRIHEPGKPARSIQAGQVAVLGTDEVAQAGSTGETPLTGAAADRPARPGAGEASHSKVAGASAQALLDRAREQRTARQWPQVATTYRTLLQQYPSSPEAGSARVALGEVLLEQLEQAQQAQDVFAEYLKREPAGTLAPEAALGRARALQRLGDGAGEARALEVFLRRFPHAVQADRARARIEALRRGGDAEGVE